MVAMMSSPPMLNRLKPLDRVGLNIGWLGMGGLKSGEEELRFQNRNQRTTKNHEKTGPVPDQARGRLG
jgi:hypothetical protein